jgi:hypothetical protein
VATTAATAYAVFVLADAAMLLMAGEREPWKPLGRKALIGRR